MKKKGWFGDKKRHSESAKLAWKRGAMGKNKLKPAKKKTKKKK
jgi:hypothetical protein